MVLFRIRKISKDDRALINVLRQEKNWSSRRLLRKFSGKNWAWTSVDRLVKKIDVNWRDKINVRKAVTVRDQFVCQNFRKKIELVEGLICSQESALHVYKYPYENGRKLDISRSYVRRIAKHDLRLKMYKHLSGLLRFDRWRHFIFQRRF